MQLARERLCTALLVVVCSAEQEMDSGTIALCLYWRRVEDVDRLFTVFDYSKMAAQSHFEG